MATRLRTSNEILNGRYMVCAMEQIDAGRSADKVKRSYAIVKAEDLSVHGRYPNKDALTGALLELEDSFRVEALAEIKAARAAQEAEVSAIDSES